MFLNDSLSKWIYIFDAIPTKITAGLFEKIVCNLYLKFYGHRLSKSDKVGGLMLHDVKPYQRFVV